MFTMIVQQLLSVLWLVASQQGAKGFLQAPNKIQRIRSDGNSNAKSSGNKSLLSSFPVDHESEGGDESDEEPIVRENDLSMFMETEDDEGGGFDPLEFFMTVDDSIQKLEEIEDFFREEPMGIMMEEKSGVVPSIQKKAHKKEHIATTNPIGSDKIRMTKKADSISIDEEPLSKRVMYYDYDGSLTKIKGNLCDSSVIYYTE